MTNGPIKCPCCGSVDSGIMYQKKDYPFILRALSEDTVIRRCCSCNAAFAHPRPTEEELAHVYNNNFYYPEEFTEVEKRGLTKYIEEIEKLHFQKRGKLLDVGCSSGFLIYVAGRRGWQVFGLDTSAKLLEEASCRLPNASLFLGKIEDASFQSNYFDAVVPINLLEHLVDPVLFLLEINRILKPGGLFLFKTVWIDSILSHKRQVHWDHLKWPGHLIWFSEKSLEILLERADFIIKKWNITGLPYIPGIKRYLDHRVYENTAKAEAGKIVQANVVKISMPVFKRVLKAILKNKL